MFDNPDRIFEGYCDYRESIGRPRVNKLEDLKDSIPYAHFVAGVEFAREMMIGEGFFPEDEDTYDEDLDAL